jgi:hypothetical protein
VRTTPVGNSVADALGSDTVSIVTARRPLLIIATLRNMCHASSMTHPGERV